jgi:hypothetical protein
MNKRWQGRSRLHTDCVEHTTHSREVVVLAHGASTSSTHPSTRPSQLDGLCARTSRRSERAKREKECTGVVCMKGTVIPTPRTNHNRTRSLAHSVVQYYTRAAYKDPTPGQAHLIVGDTHDQWARGRVACMSSICKSHARTRQQACIHSRKLSRKASTGSSCPSHAAAARCRPRRKRQGPEQRAPDQRGERCQPSCRGECGCVLPPFLSQTRSLI